MEIDPEKFKEILTFTIKRFRQMEHELLAHQLLLQGMKKTMGLGPELDLLLEQARGSEEIQQQLAERYDQPLEKFLTTFTQSELNRQLSDFLEKWKPRTGKVN
jgi:hypothetical protein